MGSSLIEIFQTGLIILQIITCPVLVILILLQSGKSDDLGSALGGGGSGSSTVLGTGGASKVLVRATVVFAVMFMLNSVGLAYIYKETLDSSVTEGMDEPITPAEIPSMSPDQMPGGADMNTAPEGSEPDSQ